MYVIGLMAGRTWLQIAGSLCIRSAAAFAFSVEIIVLIPAALSHSLGHQQVYSPAASLFIALLAFAMGLQNATLTHFSSLTVHTGFVTGTLVKMSEHLTKYFTWTYEQLRTGHAHLTWVWRRTPGQENFQKGWHSLLSGWLTLSVLFSAPPRSIFMTCVSLYRNRRFGYVVGV